jgi:hypothetical protein
MLKCIKDKCYYYFESDIFKTCKLKPNQGIIDECIGFDEIPTKMDEIIGKVALLMNKYNRLECMEDWIKDHQKENIDEYN